MIIQKVVYEFKYLKLSDLCRLDNFKEHGLCEYRSN